MKLSLVLQHLLLIILVLALTRAQWAPQPTSTATSTVPSSETTTLPAITDQSAVVAMTSAEPWTAPAIFYPFGSAVGDTEYSVIGSESQVSVALSTPFTFFGHTYNSLYVIYNGLLTFTMTAISGPYYSPLKGREDFIAALWNDFDDYFTGVISYQQYTSGSVLNRATQDINQHFSPVNFQASWVFVATWRYNLQPNPQILFQAVLISGGGGSFFLLNYGDCAALYEGTEAGYDTINSISNFIIPDSANGNYQNLKNTTNVNVTGRWAFNAWAAPAIFYPFGSTLGDTEHHVNNDENSYPVSLLTPFTFFGHTYNSLYAIYTGVLSFTISPTLNVDINPFGGNDDFIAPLWNDYDDYHTGVFSYQQYTNGSVLDRATQDINQYFSPTNFKASWVFVATWRYNLQPNPAILFQVVLISGGDWSFFLMNYGDCAVLNETMEAGYNTMNSVSNFVIPDSINGNYQNLKNTTNVNVPGRWAFISNKGLENIIGTQFKLTSYLDLTQSNNLEAVLQQIKQELVSRGLSGNFEIKKRRVIKQQP
nr:uncharacterized protein si:ch211-182p11.1 isoform X1 [Danio rerio]|eukprot:XP_005156480.1 uncharacterized protein si:ch211-182p11.1 isoform X1 [Danio rerio]